MSIRMKLDGFEELLKKIEKAGKSVESAAAECMTESADIVDAEIRASMKKSGVDESFIAAMPPPSVENEHGTVYARVGYKKGPYDPKKPSDGYKAVFLNYGTPHRPEKQGRVTGRFFMTEAKRIAKPKVKKTQKAALERILGDLK